MKDFKDKVAVITGAGSGIGRATALALAREGAKLHVSDINAARIELVANEIRSLGAEAHSYVVDSSDREAVKKFADEVFAAAGRVDILHNNAGIGVGCPIHKMPLEDWEKVINVNLWGVIYGVHFFADRMVEQGGGGHIINTASGAGLGGLPGLASYVATKFAVVGISEALNIELNRYGIYATALCPGIIKTNIVRDSAVEVNKPDGENVKQTLIDFYETFGAPPEAVAKDALTAIRRRRPLQPSPYHMYPLWILRRVSVRAYVALLRVVAGRMIG